MHIFRNFATLFHNAKFLAQIRLQQTLGSTKSNHTDIKIRRIIRRSRFSCPWLPKSSQECERSDRTKDHTWRYAATKLQFRSAAAIIFFFFFSFLLFSFFPSVCPLVPISVLEVRDFVPLRFWYNPLNLSRIRSPGSHCSSPSFFKFAIGYIEFPEWVPLRSPSSGSRRLSLAPNLVPTFSTSTDFYLPSAFNWPADCGNFIKANTWRRGWMRDIYGWYSSTRVSVGGMGERVLCSSTSCGACEHSSGVVTIEFVNSCSDSSVGLCFSGAFFVILRSGIWYSCSEFLFDLHWWTFD